MRRTLVQFDEDTYRTLREQAFTQQRSIASLVRELVADGLDGGRARKRGRARRFLSVAAGRSKPDQVSPVSEKHDAALAEAFKK